MENIKIIKLENGDDIVCSFGGGKNTPIGNYTSQWFGNLYMNELDINLKQQQVSSVLTNRSRCSALGAVRLN